ncbi:recombination regulator RecX [Rhodococcus sp. NPDC049939]|uniref:recombination regulator RecX n=1 Tax=Rhodococcus sp. NPDC049939 TaxID=3155511 RepID=UPI00340B7B1E
MHPVGGGGTETQAKDVCLRLLTDRARTRAELAACLIRKGFSVDVTERVLDRLTDVGLVNDADFALQWVHSRHTHSGKGKRALAMELRRKGIGEEDATVALAQIDVDDERQRASELVAKKLRTMSVDDRDRAVRRLVSMLARRGFSQGLSFEVVKEQLDRIGAGIDELAEADNMFDEM